MFQTIIPLFGIIWGVKFFLYTGLALFAALAALGADTSKSPAQAPKKPLIPASETSYGFDKGEF